MKIALVPDPPQAAGRLMDKNTYRQCELVKQTQAGSKLVDVAWIPACFAKVGAQLSLRRDTGNGCFTSYSEWDDGWVVTKVWGSKKLDDLDLQRYAQRRWERVLDDH